jgi:hypothetical protein
LAGSRLGRKVVERERVRLSGEKRDAPRALVFNGPDFLFTL